VAAVRISVVIPAFDAWATLPYVLDALEPQVTRPDREVILVESGPGERAGELAVGRPWLQVVSLADRTLPGRARNIGVARAQGRLVAFLDADAVPGRAWLDQLERSLDEGGGGVAAVAGAVVNANPWHPVAVAGHLLEFSDWLPGGPPDDLTHGASCNLLVRRPALERAGGFPDDVFPGEDTILSFRLAASGRMRFSPGATVGHFGHTDPIGFLRHQRRLGASFAVICRSVPFPHRGLARPALAPLTVPFRLAAIARRLTGHPADALAGLAVLPVVVAGLVAWAWGLARSGRPRSRSGAAAADGDR
jgi:GT2 family glycosyltransferase